MTDVEPAQSAAGAGLRPAYAASRAHLGLVFALFALAGVGWWWTIRQMRGMDNGPWTDLGTFGWFLSVWIVMMAAMMFPSVAPTVALYARMSQKSRPAPVVFVTGYLITWTGAGIIAFLIGMVGSHVAPHLAWEHAGRFLTGATLLLAAAYELTPLKNICLSKCRSPLGFLLGSWRDGWSGALRMGARNGAWCVGCCWALMASLFALGVMSPIWMAIVAGLIAIEKTFPWRRTATYGTATILLALGVLVLAAPDALPTLTVPGSMR
jgi:predicted metal-binding membrane protein